MIIIVLVLAAATLSAIELHAEGIFDRLGSDTNGVLRSILKLAPDRSMNA